ncbi:FtsX-like permease family protein [Enterococcus sp. LJL99]
MKKTALLKTSLREISQSKTRFLSILGIIFLGVMLFVGLRATGPDMTLTASNYFEKENLADARIVSSLGLVSKDIDELKAIKEVDQVQANYTKDININDKNASVKFISYNADQKRRLNNFLLVDGRMPEKSGEIVLDELAKTNGYYKLNDTVTLSDEDNKDHALKKNSYKVVGFVQSPEYIESTSRGNTTIGKGSLDFFAVVPAEDFDLSAYTEALVTFKNTKGLDSYSNAYKKERETSIDIVKKALKERPEQRVAEIREDSKEALDKAQQEITDGENALKDGQETLDKSKAELETGKQQFTEAQNTYAEKIAAGESELAENAQTLNNGEAELESQRVVLESKKNELATAFNQVTEGQNALNGLYQQKTELSTTNTQLEQATAGYQTLASSIADFQKYPDDQLPVVVGQEAGSLQASVQALGGPVEVTNAVNQLIADPTKNNIAVVMGTINAVLNNLSSQQAQVTQGIATINQTIDSINSAIDQYHNGQDQLTVAENQLAAAQTQIDQGKQQLAAGKEQLEQAKIDGQAQLDEAQAKLVEGQQAYEKGLAEFQAKKKENQPKLESAKKELAEKRQELADLKSADYYYFDRDDNPGYTEYEENANRIASLAQVFPIFFFLIAALVSLTTMTRMVEEKRMEIGSLKALGYKNGQIAFKFLVYAVTASLCGSIIGLVLGYYLFPTIIFNAYGQLYDIPNFVTPWYLSYSVMALLVAILCTAGAAMIVLRIDLFNTPASLLRPKTPKAGQRIFLERIKPIWNRMSFIQKVTARNLFRYKQRMLMTVLGIAGCMALIITGFGIRDSISDIVAIQFDKIWHYEAVVTFKEDASKEETESYESSLAKIKQLNDVMPLYTETLTTTNKQKTAQDVPIYVPEKPESLNQFISLKDRKTKEAYKLADQGVIINEKLAKLFDYKKGDYITLKNADHQEYKLLIVAISENYTGHYAYMSPTYYEKIFNQKPVYNTEFLKFDKKLTTKDEETIGKVLMENGKVLNVTFLSSLSDALDDTIGSLNIVIWVLIIVSGLLAFIVLYNLTNINVSERVRELSTIKVLGFYNKEVTMYVYRENITLTLIGIIIGCFFGKIVHGYVLQTVEVDMLMFSPTINWLSYLYAAAITFIFSLLVMLIIHRKLKKVDMIEALKSNE